MLTGGRRSRHGRACSSCEADPEGYVVHVASGEGHAEGIGRLLEELVAEHNVKGTLRRGDGPYVPPPSAASELSFPGKALRLLDGTVPSFAEPQGLCLLDDGRVLVADTANHLLRTLDLTTGTVETVAGTGKVRRPGDPAAVRPCP